jgi:hypothetical protein
MLLLESFAMPFPCSSPLAFAFGGDLINLYLAFAVLIFALQQ